MIYIVEDRWRKSNLKHQTRNSILCVNISRDRKSFFFGCSVRNELIRRKWINQPISSRNKVETVPKVNKLSSTSFSFDSMLRHTNTVERLAKLVCEVLSGDEFLACTADALLDRSIKKTIRNEAQSREKQKFRPRARKTICSTSCGLLRISGDKKSLHKASWSHKRERNVD